MSYQIDATFKRSKGRRNKENQILNKPGSKTPLDAKRRTGPCLSSLLLKKKTRLKLKEQSANASTFFAKRYSFQVKPEGVGARDKPAKAPDFGQIKKKVLAKERAREATKKGRKKKRAAEQPGASSKGETGRRKNKTYSSNTFGLSKILKKAERRNRQKELRAIPLDKGRCLGSGGRGAKKASARNKENTLKSGDRLEQVRLQKPPLLHKPGNYSSHNPNLRRLQFQGVLKRKLSINLPNNLSLQNARSKPNSPSYQMKANFEVSPRGFKTMVKDSGEPLEKAAFLPAPGLPKTDRPKTHSFFGSQDEGAKGVTNKTDNLRRILNRKRSRKGGMFSSRLISVGEAGPTLLSCSIPEAQLKSPFLDAKMSPATPLNPMIYKQPPNKKDIFSFNKSSRQNALSERPETSDFLNNTSLLYNYNLNQSKTPGSFILFKNKIGSNVSGLACPEKPSPLQNQSLCADPRVSGHQSFVRTHRNLGQTKKRSKSFFELDFPKGVSNSYNFRLPAKSDQNILSLQSRAAESESDRDQLTRLIESLQERQEDTSCVQVIEEEQEVSVEALPAKRPATLEGISFRFFRCVNQ